jgi:branched-chain amino acid transport system permease protein
VVVEVLTGNVIRDVVGPWAFVIYGALVMVLIAVLPEGIVSRSFALRLTAPLRRLRRRRVESGVLSHARVERAGETVLMVRHVGHRYDGVVALDDVSLEVRGGEVLALIGANGAGKSTLIDVVSGRVPNEVGAVTLLGTRIDGMPAHRRKASGVGRTFQDVRSFAHLTVEESLRLSAADGARSNATVEAMLDRVALGGRRDDLPEALTVAERRRLDIARAAVAMPSVLLLDEPSVGMVEQERIEIAELIGSLRDEGMAVVVVDHNLDLALGLADRVAVLDFGELIALGSPDAVLADERVRAAYLGHADPLDGVGS